MSKLCGVMTVLLVMSLSLTTTAFAQNPRLYLSGGGVYVASQDADVARPLLFQDGAIIEFHSGLGAVGAIGVDWGGGFRTDLEYGRRKVDLGQLKSTDLKGKRLDIEFHADLTTDLLMANVWYVLNLEDVTGISWDGVNAYVGAGVGFAWHELEGSNVVESRDSVLAYQAMAGLGYDLTDALEVRTGYRYVKTVDYKDHGTDLDYSTHGWEFGFLYRFN